MHINNKIQKIFAMGVIYKRSMGKFDIISEAIPKYNYSRVGFDAINYHENIFRDYPMIVKMKGEEKIYKVYQMTADEFGILEYQLNNDIQAINESYKTKKISAITVMSDEHIFSIGSTIKNLVQSIDKTLTNLDCIEDVMYNLDIDKIKEA